MLAHVSFECAVCGAAAGTFSVDDAGTVVIAGFLGRVTQRIDRPAPDTWRALADMSPADACRMLHALNAEWAPWYCPACDAVYCRDHWSMRVEFEEDAGLPAWYDRTLGTCPRGHERVLDD